MKKNKDSRTRNINNKNSETVSTRLTNTYNIELELVEVSKKSQVHNKLKHCGKIKSLQRQFIYADWFTSDVHNTVSQAGP